MYPIEFFFRAARLYPKNLAIQSPGRDLTYAELTDEVRAVAHGLQQIDPSPGSRVAICGTNSLEHVIAFLAVLAAGKVWIPLNARSAVPELNRIIQFTAPSIIISDSKHRDGLSLTSQQRMLQLDGNVPDSISALTDAHRGHTPQRCYGSESHLQAIKFTGGSTGAPKGVMQSYRTWQTTIANLIDAYGYTQADRNLLAAPITHGAGTYLLPILARGGCHVILEEVSATAVLDALATQGISCVFMPPTLFYMVIEAAGKRGYEFPAIRHLIYGGAPMPVTKIREAQRFFGPVVGVTYGQTEAPQIVTFLTGEDLATDTYVGSVGRPSLFSDMAIMGSDGTIQPAGETGEIVVRGPMIMSGYLDLPEKTAEAIVDGWLHTGDLGYMDENGYLFLRGRSRDVIITGGFNVYPNDVEEVLNQHPDVLSATVFGVDDPKWGEAVHAAIQLRKEASATADEIIQYAKGQMGSVKTPKAISFFDELPRNPVGKVDKVSIKKQVQEQMAQAK